MLYAKSFNGDISVCARRWHGHGAKHGYSNTESGNGLADNSDHDDSSARHNEYPAGYNNNSAWRDINNAWNNNAGHNDYAKPGDYNNNSRSQFNRNTRGNAGHTEYRRQCRQRYRWNVGHEQPIKHNHDGCCSVHAHQ